MECTWKAWKANQKMEYKLKPPTANPFWKEADAKRRAKVEKVAGKPFTDVEWYNYKRMIMPKSGNK